MKKIELISLAIVAVCAVSCSNRRTVEQTTVTVKTATVQSYGNGGEQQFPGKVRAATDIDLAFKVDGNILKRRVNEGAFVKKGAVIIEMDPRDYQLQFDATEAEYNQIKGDAERVMKLYEQQSVAQSDYDKARYGLKQIESKYAAHRNALDDTKLCAPFDCYVQTFYHSTGETVGAGMPVVSVINNSLPEVEINIPSSEYIRSNQFTSYSCTVDIWPDKVFALEPIGINHKANLNQLYTMRLRLKGKVDGMIPTAGMVTMVRITSKTDTTSLATIPASALRYDSDGASVWIFDTESQTVSERKVKVARLLKEGTAVIESGVTAGETVVSAGVNVLTEGEKVTPIKPTTETNVGGML